MKILLTKTSYLLLAACFTVLIISSCKTGNKKANDEKEVTDTVTITNTKNNTSADTTQATFDITTIPVSTKEIGTFPYLQAPETYTYHDITKSDLKTVHFAVKGILTPVEGKTYSSNIYKKQESETPFNATIVQREYEKMIKELGGIQVSSNLLPGQAEKIGIKLLEAEGDHAYTIIGVNDYTINHVNTYIIRTAKVTVWVELSFYQNGGYIYILEKESI